MEETESLFEFENRPALTATSLFYNYRFIYLKQAPDSIEFYYYFSGNDYVRWDPSFNRPGKDR